MSVNSSMQTAVAVYVYIATPVVCAFHARAKTTVDIGSAVDDNAIETDVARWMDTRDSGEGLLVVPLCLPLPLPFDC